MVYQTKQKTYNKKTGSRSAVWDDIAYQTASGLLKSDLKMNSRGKLVSVRKSKLAAERYKLNGGSFSKSKTGEKPEVSFMEKLFSKKKCQPEVSSPSA